MFDLGRDGAANVTAGRAAAAFATNLSAPRALRVHERHLYWIEAGRRRARPRDARDARRRGRRRGRARAESVTPAFPRAFLARSSQVTTPPSGDDDVVESEGFVYRAPLARVAWPSAPNALARRTTTTAPAAEPTAAAAARELAARRRSASPRG